MLLAWFAVVLTMFLEILIIRSQFRTSTQPHLLPWHLFLPVLMGK